MKRIVKKLGFWALYATYLLVFLGAVDYLFFYRPFLKEIAAHKRGVMPAQWNPDTTQLKSVPYVDRDLMQRLGKVEDFKTSVFTRFPREKPEGVIRICCFGDSHTGGDEVADGYDYPALLQALVDRRGVGDVEVVNFGVGGYGFHQSYILWDSVARGFGCDYRLLGPRGFQALRDTTFGFHSGWSPYYLHARYVLDGAGGVRLVEIPGATYGERFAYHFRFIQPWSVLRYTRNPPLFLQALIPRDRTLGNPFYYDKRGMVEEANETYAILLAKMAEEESQIVLGAHRREIAEIGRAVTAANLSSALFHEPVTFPYLAQNSHAGPQGNRFLARQFLAQLTAGEEPLTILETHDLDWRSRTAESRPKRPLESYSKVDFEIAGIPLGSLVVNHPLFGVLEVDGLLALNGTDTVTDSCFAPVETELQPGMKVVLRMETADGTTDHPIGDVVPMGGGLNIGVVEAEGFEYMVFKDLKHLHDAGVVTPLTRGKKRPRGLFFHGHDGLDMAAFLHRATRVSVLLDGKTILAGERSRLDAFRGFWMRPTVSGPCRQVKAGRSGVLDPDELDDSGLVELVAEHWEDGVVRVPIAAWKKSLLPAPRTERPVARPLALRPDGPATPVG